MIEKLRKKRPAPRQYVSYGADGVTVWRRGGPRERDWDRFYIDLEPDGMSPYERKRYLRRLR